MLWPPDRACRVLRHHLANDQPVEEHPDRGEQELDRGRGDNFTQALDIGRDMHGTHLAKLVYPVICTPGGKITRRAPVCFSGVSISDLRGEKLEDPFGRFRIRSKKRVRGQWCFLQRYRKMKHFWQRTC